MRLASDHGQNDTFTLPPHDYGVAVILLAIADRAVPAAQVEPLRAGVRQYLFASALDGGVDKSRAPAEFEKVGRMAALLPEPSKTLLRHVSPTLNDVADRRAESLDRRDELLAFVHAASVAHKNRDDRLAVDVLG